MPGCNPGFSVSAEFTVASTDPLDPKVAVRPDELARALERNLKGVVCSTSVGDHTIHEVHIYRVAPTLASIRLALGLPVPWVDPVTGKRKPLPPLGRKAPAPKGPASKKPSPKTTAKKKPPKKK